MIKVSEYGAVEWNWGYNKYCSAKRALFMFLQWDDSIYRNKTMSKKKTYWKDNKLNDKK